MILLVQHQPNGVIDSVAFLPPAEGGSLEMSGGLPVLRVAARDALKSWKGETLADAALRQECARAGAELREKYLVQHGKLVPRG
jgi:hypothetical protein